MDKDKGWEFLFGDNKKSGSFHAEDGSEGYIYSDGSGYYKGADGSDGYIYSDGSGYYRGADGSDGYKYSDGSGYFRGGSNEVDAYQYSDGSGYYGDSKHSRSHYWPLDNSTHNSPNDHSSNSSNETSWAELGGVLLGAGLLSLLAQKSNREEDYADSLLHQEERQQQLKEEREKQARRKARRNAFIRKHWKGIIISILCVILAIVLAIGVQQHQKMIPISLDSESLAGMDYEKVIILLNEAGFTNVDTECTMDLDYENLWKENQVYQVYVNEKNSFEATDKFPYDADITVKYHGAKAISVPRSSKEMKGANYENVVDEFKSAGFANIELVIKYDIITGWLTDDGEVESVVINGEKKFSAEAQFRPDAKIVITYHTLKKNEKSE